MSRKVNTVNRGRASHYVNGAQPLKVGFSRDLARLKFNRTYVCKPDEVKRLKAELAAEKAKAEDNTELTNERKDDFNGTFTATTGASTEAEAGTRDSLAKQLKDKTQELADKAQELTNEQNAGLPGSLAKQLANKTQELADKAQELTNEQNAGLPGSLAKQLADANALIDTLMAIPRSVNSGNRLLTTGQPYTIPLKKIQFISGEQAQGTYDNDKIYTSIWHNTDDTQTNQMVAMMNLDDTTQRAVFFNFDQTTGQITNLRCRFLTTQTPIADPTTDQLTERKTALQNGDATGKYANTIDEPTNNAWGLKNVLYKYFD